MHLSLLSCWQSMHPKQDKSNSFQALSITTEGESSETSDTAKKRQRKKKKNSQANNKGEGHARSSAPPQESTSLNPNMQLRSKLIAQGYTSEAVDSAMESMWNEHLPYDDFEAVLTFLRRKTPTHAQNEEEHTTESSTGLTSATTMLTMDEEISSTGGATKDSGLDEQMNTRHHDDTASSSVARSRGSRRRSKASSRPLTLASKLDLVADYENFTDAVFALTEWTTKAAKQPELEELCEAKTTSALPKVLRRAITEDDSDSSKFEQKVMPSILHLVGCVLLNMGLSYYSVSAIRKNLETVLKQARRALVRSQDDKKKSALAENISNHVVSRVHNAIQKFKAKTEGNDEQMIHRLENEIETVVSSLSTTGETGIVELMIRRDMQKEVAEKSSVVVGVSITSAVHKQDKEETKHSGEKSSEKQQEMEDVTLSKEDLIRILVGDDDLGKLEATKIEHETLQAEASKAKLKLDSLSKDFESKLEGYRAERGAIGDKLAELRRQILLLEEQDAGLCEKIATTEQEAEEAKTLLVKEIGELNGRISKSSGPYEFATSVHKLATGLKVYDESLKKAVADPAMPSSDDEPANTADEIPRKMGVYLVHAKEYFRSEAKCIKFLRARLESFDKEARSLEHDLEECNALGMKTNAAQITKSLTRARENIEDDNSVVKGLRHEAQILYEDLVARLKQYVSSERGAELSSIHVSVLRGIVSSLTEIGLDNNTSLQAYLSGTKADAKSDERPASTAPAKERGGDTLPAKAAASVDTVIVKEKDMLKAKLTWARKPADDKDQKKAEKKSLLEIQQEELDSNSSAVSVETMKK